MKDLAQKIIARCSTDPKLVVQLWEHLDLKSLDTKTGYRVTHAVAAAWWYIDRNKGKEILKQMWQRYRSTGFLFTLECAQLLDFYAETWESVADHVTVPWKPERIPEITLVTTTCRRFDLFVRTINAFLKYCTDRDLIGRWICIDDNSCEDDRRQMQRLYPFFEFVWKSPEDRGHARSLQIAQDMVTSPYIFLLEDDQELFIHSNYITRCLRGLSVGTSIGQCLVNVNYAESVDDYKLTGGLPFQHDGDRFVAHLFDPERKLVRGLSSCHWPHFSLRPGLLRREVWDLGFRCEGFFEWEFACRYMQTGWRSIFLPDIYHRHIGRRVGADGENAYTLNRTRQFS